METRPNAEVTALASGSGDHADLARSLRRADEYQPLGHDGWKAADALETLLAENAALRGENEHVKKLRHQAIDRSRLWEIDAIEWETRATEAGRKLAEAVEWRPIETAPRDGTVVLGWSSFFPTRRPLEVSWDDDRYARKPAPRWVACAAAYNRRAFFEHPLTHWLPLPPAPGAEDE